jgi:hypothetical protein
MGGRAKQGKGGKPGTRTAFHILFIMREGVEENRSDPAQIPRSETKS